MQVRNNLTEFKILTEGTLLFVYKIVVRFLLEMVSLDSILGNISQGIFLIQKKEVLR